VADDEVGEQIVVDQVVFVEPVAASAQAKK